MAAQCSGNDAKARVTACSQLIGNEALPSSELTTVYNNRGVALTELGQTTAAIKDFDASLSASQNNVHAFSNRALAYDTLGNTGQAITDLTQAIALQPNDATNYNNRCYVRAKAGQMQEALTDCQSAIVLQPTDARTLDTLGYVLFRLKNFKEAIHAYDTALEIAPKLAASLYGRGVAKERLKLPGVSDDIQAAIDADPSVSSRMNSLGVTIDIAVYTRQLTSPAKVSIAYEAALLSPAR